MKITVIVADKVVVVDNLGFDCTFNFEVPENLRAIQFDGDTGEAEWFNQNNTTIDFKFVEPFYNAWKLSKIEYDEASLLAKQQLEEMQSHYWYKRANEYPTIGDQLDALFKSGAFPEEMAAKIQAIKDKYPKPEA
jgi:hypothetical protein